MDQEVDPHKESALHLHPKQVRILRNIRCAYCGNALKPEDRTRDHVIGRKFVPKGKLNAQWNLIVNACRNCNNIKSNLEDDIAAITLMPDPSGKFTHDDVGVVKDAQRRGLKSISRRTRKPVNDSFENFKLEGNLGPDVGVKINFVAPPQIDEMRAFELARLHLTALFFMQTYNSETFEGGWWLHGFHPIRMLRCEDWGNPIIRSFMASIREWDCRLIVITACGFFKAMTRRHPSADCWAWAVEWNQSHRLFGFFGEREPAQQIVNGFSTAHIHTIFEYPDHSSRFSKETRLSDADDTLFDTP